MSYVGELALADGSVLLVEVQGEAPPGVDRVGRLADGLRQGAQSLDEALAGVRPALQSVVDTVRGLATVPQAVTVQFGITVVAGAGVVVARAATEASFTVTATWDNSASASAAGPS
ncbi:CU044_2847 family protein [Streptomyces sp. NPDC002088]|uniref:CU044_2847 family protein n=1 Tax=unclassified Streptomyces TaxID=2593676 RepID=UPI00332AAE66